MTDLLTISEYSKARGCSVSAVYKRLKSPSNRIHNYVVQRDGQTFLKAEIIRDEELSPLATTDRPPQKNFSEAENRSTTAPKPVEEVEEKPVEEGLGVMALKLLEQQLAQKDKQIEDLNRRLEDAMKHAQETSDKLAALVVQANELQRNNQLLLAQAQQPKIEVAPVDPEPDPEPAPVPDPKEEPKRSFWSKLFRK